MASTSAATRRSNRHPIIVLTADGAEDRKVEALGAGADDYVTKPFSLPDSSPASAPLRHRTYLSSVLDNDAIQVGALTIDVDAHVALLGGGVGPDAEGVRAPHPARPQRRQV